MYLKKIEVKGFKSFADKIELDFETGITAVVGPNGSGKSNISDAIRWVLGEQSAKSLRGSKMEDVIFAGTEKRGALGYAEVSLVIDNSDSLIDFDYSEITVKRRLYRTGESEYSINGTQCRLKDILEVFMDTGIGKDGYSLIGQGKIDEILSTRSDDRRHLFEEAAGIVKYKWRKNEAERKLENTKQNLLRIDDIIEELEVQIEPLKMQSENARKYLSYRDELKEIDINLAAHNYSELNERLTKSQNEEITLKKTKLEYENKRALIQGESEALKENLKDIEEKFTKANKDMIEMEKSFENKQGHLKLLNERHDNIIKEKGRIKEEIDEEKKVIHKIDEELSLIFNKKTEEEKKLLEVKKELADEEIRFKGIYEKCLESESLIESKKADAIQVLKDLSSISNKENTSKLNIKNLENRKAQILGEKKIKEDRKLGLMNLINSSESELQRINLLTKDIKTKIEVIKSKIQEYENEITLLTKDRNRIFDLLKQREAKALTLSAMEKDMEGFSRAVKSVIKRYSSREEVFGTINEIIEVPRGYEIAIETALSSSLQNIVVKDENIASDAIEYLKKNNLGRATFYPLTTIKGRYGNISNSVKEINGFRGIASDILRFEDKFKNVITNLLGRVIICDNLINAREIAKKTDYTFRIVTLDGDVINSGGSYTGGSSNFKNSGLISRKNTIKVLEEEIESYKTKLKDCESSIESKKNQLISKSQEEEKETNEYQKMLTKVNSESANISSIKNSLKMIEEDVSDLLIELEQIECEISNNNEFSKDTSNEKNELLIKQDHIEKEIKNITLKFKDESKLKEDMQEQITKIKIRLTGISKSVESIDDRINILKKDKASHERRINIFSSKIIDMDNTAFETQEETKIIIVEIQRISKDVIDLKNKIHEMDNYKKEGYEKREYLEKEYSKVEESIKDIFESIHKYDIQNSKMEMEIDSLKKRLWEEYEMTIPEALKIKRDINSVQEESKKVQGIKNLIKALGNININAIEEYIKVTERYEFLTGQKDDLLEAEASLMKVIEEMTVKMRQQFCEKFKIMKENFNETFKELFGGGYADLKMEEDDPLTSGIDIIVQPPGKKLQNLTLLSGGEKGLSAIALVFAILKMKPTPFCILDEIEAALDDANVNRYAKFLREYSKNTQFIIITHRKGSMAVADSLYGVTMEEKGISKIISLKLEGGI
ncbi:chromosome segregation protein SMC [Clostridium cylindrosporum]|uniref:Chromosome partition protein Smc n=1 Tax=Clostridium cylindrosporum DSM 605 TaxID=1121307 RepID=A0A0J8G139_CLOCY|nr:chromosome segregation protein SMC [Clostridium cylindrosporum]KMT21481.1 chromosome partition protein Smc [Clostridium cylindrosporum DSM 605]